jgi:hypothetical protein
MKDAEDEAFDDLARKQGSWGGGFPAKRAMAADKYSDIVSDGGLDPRNQFDAQPAQEPVQPVVVAQDANADDMNRLHGEDYGVDWVYPHTHSIDAELLSALKLVVEQEAPTYHDCTDNGLLECHWCKAFTAITKAEAAHNIGAKP